MQRSRFLRLTLFLTALVTVGPRGVAAQRAVGDTAAVAQAVRAFGEALVRGDSTAALALLAPDAIVLESGAIESRAEYRAHHLAADIQFAQAIPPHTGPLRIRIEGDVAWVSSSSTVDGTVDGRAVHSTSAALMVLARSADGWTIRAIHWSSRRRAAPTG